MPRGIEFLNRREVRSLTGFCPAAIEVDTDGLPPDSSLRKLRPVLDDTIGVGSVIGILRLNPSPTRENACKHGHASGEPKRCSRVVAHLVLPSHSIAQFAASATSP